MVLGSQLGRTVLCAGLFQRSPVVDIKFKWVSHAVRVMVSFVRAKAADSYASASVGNYHFPSEAGG